MAATTEQISCATWQPLTVGISEKSKGPSPRAGHSFVFDPESNASYVFGGASHEEGLSNEIYQLDHGGLIQYIAKCPNSSSAVTATLTWRFLDLEGKPPARYEHCAVLASRRGRRVMLVLFGAADEQPLGDIWSLDLESFKWTCLEARGALPPPRTLSHCVLNSVNGKDRLYIFGGGMAGDIPLNDANVYCLDVESLFWAKVFAPSETTESPQPMLGHSLTKVGSQMFLYGGLSGTQIHDGLWAFDLKKHTWTRLQVQGDLTPESRVAHSATAWDDSHLLVYGGMARFPKLKAFEDVLLFNTNTLTWTLLGTAALPPGPPGARLDHSACLVSRLSRREDGISENVNRITDESSSAETTTQSLMVFGGMNIGCVLNDLFELDVSL